jgi:glycosyltransferase involved in cell wall biosynthesis
MSQPIRVLELIYGFQLGGRGGGIGRFGIELCRTLNRQQLNVYLCGLFDRGTSQEEKWLTQLYTEGIPVFCASKWDEQHPYRSFWNSSRFLWNWQSQYNADIVHSHSEFTDVAALILNLHPKRPVILRTVHYGFQYEWREKPLRRLLLTNLLYPLLFNIEIGVSQAITANLNQRPLAKLLKRRAQCVNNAINLQRFQRTNLDQTSKRMSLNVPIDAPLIGTVGRLTEQKGYTYLIDAAALVLEQIPQAYFLIVGDGELADTLKDQAHVRGITNHVLFTGARSDIEEILACLDIFVSASLWEGLPTVIMESMAAGIAIVATDIPGTRELVRDQHTAWLVPPANVYALAQTLLTALKDSQSRQEFANRAYQDIKSLSIKSIAIEYEKIYSAALQGIRQ